MLRWLYISSNFILKTLKLPTLCFGINTKELYTQKKILEKKRYKGLINTKKKIIRKKKLTEFFLSKFGIDSLIIEIIKIFQQYTVDVLKLKNQFTISTSWFTKMKPKDTCRFHRHYNSFYSGLYYFNDYEVNSGNICFLDPLNSFNNFLIVPDSEQDCSIHNSKEWKIRPEKNMLIFFPSYLEHSILSNTSKKNRYSLAFNFVPIGKYGVSDSTYNTEWFKT